MNVVYFGASGGLGGLSFSDDAIMLDKNYRIKKIVIRAGTLIDAVQICWVDPSGKDFWGQRHGGNGGREYTFNLDPDEYILGIQGKYQYFVNSLQLVTNKRTSQLYGGTGGEQHYSYNRGMTWPGMKVIGFWGKSGTLVDSIGCLFKSV